MTSYFHVHRMDSKYMVVCEAVMNVALIAYGIRADVRPFVLVALMARGHEVALAVPPNFRLLRRELGVSVSAFTSNPRG